VFFGITRAFNGRLFVTVWAIAQLLLPVVALAGSVSLDCTQNNVSDCIKKIDTNKVIKVPEVVKSNVINALVQAPDECALVSKIVAMAGLENFAVICNPQFIEISMVGDAPSSGGINADQTRNLPGLPQENGQTIPILNQVNASDLNIDEPLFMPDGEQTTLRELEHRLRIIENESLKDDDPVYEPGNDQPASTFGQLKARQDAANKAANNNKIIIMPDGNSVTIDELRQREKQGLANFKNFSPPPAPPASN
jgi:hypothetical protein